MDVHNMPAVQSQPDTWAGRIGSRPVHIPQHLTLDLTTHSCVSLWTGAQGAHVFH